jgi:hypothetical protein
MADKYRPIAEQAVSLLLSIGCYGLDRSKQRQLWQEALDLDRELHPSFPRVEVWTAEEGDIEPPRHPESSPEALVAAERLVDR